MPLGSSVPSHLDAEVRLYVFCGALRLPSNELIFVSQRTSDDCNGVFCIQCSAGASDMPQPENCIPTDIKVGMRCELEADALDPAALAIRGIHAQHNGNVEKFFRVATLKRGVNIDLCPALVKRSHSCTGDVYCVSLNVGLWPAAEVVPTLTAPAISSWRKGRTRGHSRRRARIPRTRASGRTRALATRKSQAWRSLHLTE